MFEVTSSVLGNSNKTGMQPFFFKYFGITIRKVALLEILRKSMMMSEIRSLWQEETITRIYSYLLLVKIKGTFTLDCSKQEGRPPTKCFLKSLLQVSGNLQGRQKQQHSAGEGAD